MIFGNLNKVLENEQTIYEAVKDNIFTTSARENKMPSKVSNILMALSHYGMNYNKDLIKNLRAVPADKMLQQDSDKLIADYYSQRWDSSWNVTPEEDKPFAEKTLQQKRDILRKMAMQIELDDILDIMTNEAIVPDENEAYICKPFIDTALAQDLIEQKADELRNAVDTAFYKIYTLTDFKKKGWDDFKRWLIDGVVAYEIQYDNLQYPKTITNIVPVDPVTLTREVKDGVTYWIQYKGQIERERVLLDAEIIYIKYEDTQVTERQSYLERLIRPFNIYRIIEQAQVIWTVTQASFKMKFTIPVGNMNRAKGAQTLNQAMNRYKEDISFNNETGELRVNDKTNLPFNKEYWLASNEQGTPEIETLTDNGPSLDDSEQINYFLRKLYKSSKIPASRFDKDAQSQWFGSDPTQALREEINFTRFVNKLRNTFGELLLKPLRIQVSLSQPDIKNDKRILNAISLQFNSYNPFAEMMNIEIMGKRVEFIGNFQSTITTTDADGNEIPYFTPKFLIMKYLHMSDADLELNEKIKLEELLAKKKKEKSGGDDKGGDDSDDDGELGGGDDSGGDDGDLGGGDDNGGAEDDDDNGGDLDSEMLGTVQPEKNEQ